MEQEIPNWILEDNREKSEETEECWKNTENHTRIYVMRNEGKWGVEEKEGDWMVTGENSLLYVEDSFEKAKEKAVEWMLDSPNPSPMV